jgi:hypothetical protein
MHQEADMEVTVAGINPEVAMEEVAAATNLEGDTAETVVEINQEAVMEGATNLEGDTAEIVEEINQEAATNLEGDTAEIVVETNNRVVVWEATAAGTNPEEGMEMIAVETNLEEAATVVGINPEVSGSSS